MEYRIYPDGSLDAACLAGSYPEIDGFPIRPIRVETGADFARFSAAAGILEIRLRQEADGILLSCRTEGFDAAHDISPLGGAVMRGVSEGFRQGIGITGPSGMADAKDDWSSDGLTALRGEWGCVTLHARDHLRFRHHYEAKGGRLSARFDAEGTLRGETRFPDIHLWPSDDLYAGLRRCAGDIASAMGARVPTEPAFHWCSWYYLYHNLDMPTLREYTSAFRSRADFSHIQIDAGYFPAAGDWLISNERFPEGMADAGRVILDAGFQPGIWIAPFMVGDRSRLFREHPDWMLRAADGSLLAGAKQYNEPKMWGYADCELYILDTSHPDAMEYLRQVFATYKKWGYTLFKTDFLLWGLQDSAKVRRHTPGKTSFEYFRDVMDMIRSAIGDARWLGCIAPFLPCVGRVDMMRIAGDVGASWSGDAFGPDNMLRETLADRYFDGVYWLNDPDAVMLRDFHIYMEKPQVEAIALFQAMTSSVIYTSDPVHRIAPDRQALLRLIHPRDVLKSEYPGWMQGKKEIVVVNRVRGGADILLFNPTHEELTVPFDPAALTGLSCLWEWHRGALSIPGYCVLPPRSARLFFVSDAPLPSEPENLWDW